MSCDALLLIPFEPPTGMAIEPAMRKTFGANFFLPLVQAMSELEGFLGRSLDMWQAENRPTFSDGQRLGFPVHRSLTAVALATVLEQAGLSWHIVDPGTRELSYWRRRMQELRDLRPRVVGISTTFLITEPWIATLVALARESFPRATIVVGGYYYGSSTEQFLSFDADIFFVGEGELRLPRLVEAIKHGRQLVGIEGLYLRRGDGTLTFTGPPKPLDLSVSSKPDWRLAERCDPRVSLKDDYIEMGLETQRGCVFRCGFCTYRTLASPNIMNPDAAIEGFMRTAGTRKGAIILHDATGTFPHKRWEEIMEGLVVRGGSPHPIWAFARTNDIKDERTAELMYRAGVRMLYVGQESADQRMLDLMHKGTKASRILPGLRAAGKHGIVVHLGLIHGYPGETQESIECSRRLLATVNDGFAENPVVLTYNINPFWVQDFAAVNDSGSVQRKAASAHGMEYQAGEFDGERACLECIQSVIATSKIPTAPVLSFIFGKAPSATGIILGTHPRRAELHTWMKSVERGIAVYLDLLVNGTRPKFSELDRLARTIDRFHEEMPRRTHRAAGRVVAGVAKALHSEWVREPRRGVGPLTRLLVASTAWMDTRNMRVSARALQTGTYPRFEELAGVPVVRPTEERVTELANVLIANAKEEARYHKLKVV